MKEYEESSEEHIGDIVRKKHVGDDIETLWLKEYFESHKEISEEVEKLIYEKVEKYVTEEGFPIKGIDKEYIIREMVTIFSEKTLSPATAQRGITHESFMDFHTKYTALVTHLRVAKMQAEELSKSDLKKVYGEITTEEKEEKNE